VTTRLDNGYQVDYGVRADDPAIRQVLEGLYMLASVAPGSVPDEAYAAWQDTAITRLVDGYQAVVDLSAQLGFKEAMINDAITRHQATMAQLNNQVADLEAADPYETAMRLSQLQTQLEATFSITARMNELTLTKFL
jgi:flagellar hook-associated protein 3 FlgL